MAENFKFVRKIVGPFRLYRGKGEPGQIHVVRVSKPYERGSYYNAFAVNEGYLDCHGPEGYGIQRFNQYDTDTELPDYTVTGTYEFRPGLDGVDVWCCSTAVRGMPFQRRVISLQAEEEYVVQQDHVLILCRGRIQTNNAGVVRAPVVVDGTQMPKVIKAENRVKGMELWI